MTLNRSRWAAVGAAVAVSLGAGGLGLVKAATPASEPSTFVPITNCRIFDTRSNHDVGTFNEPLGPGSEITVEGHGESGDCTIPDTATGLQLNVTAVNATETTHLTVFPADATETPDASNLNPQFGHGTAFNAVTTRLSPDGQFKVSNFAGTIDVLADVTGYFIPAGTETGPAPAAAATDGDDVADIAMDDVVVVDATISTDGSGYVHATSVGSASGELDDLSCSLSDSATFDDGSAQTVWLTADQPTSITTLRTFTLTEAGDLTVNLVCKGSGATGTATVENPQIQLTFIPGTIPVPELT